MNQLHRHLQVLAVLLCCLAAPNLRAENPPALSHCWDGGGGNNLWSNPLNWCGDVLPDANSIVLINNGQEVSLDMDASIKELQLSGKLSGSGDLDIADDCILNGGGFNNGFLQTGDVTVGGNLTLSNSTQLANTGNLTIEGDFNLVSGYVGGYLVNAPGIITVNGTLNMTQPGNHYFTAKQVICNGGINEGAGNFYLENGAIFTNAAGSTWTNTQGSSLYRDASAGPVFGGTINNMGTMTCTIGSALHAFQDDIIFNNSGRMSGGTAVGYQFAGAFINSGTLEPGLNSITNLNLHLTSANVSPIGHLKIQIVPDLGLGAVADKLNITNLNLTGATLTVTPSPGIPPGVYPFLTWTGTRTGSFATLNLPPGYSVAYDDVLKKASLNVVALCFTLKTTFTKISCNGGSNGTAKADPQGPDNQYTYEWSNMATTQTISGLSAGAYTVTVTKISSGCTNSATVVVPDPPLLTVTLTAKNPKCFGNSTGSVGAKGTGGSGQKTYAWSTGGTGYNIQNLGPGTYTVTVTDAKGCTATAEATLTEPTELTLSYSVETLANGKFVVSLTAAGGTPYPTGVPYKYCRVSNTGSCGFGPNSMFTVAVAGTYTFRARDKNGCVASVDVTLPPALGPGAADERGANIAPTFSVSPNPFDNQLIVRANAPIPANCWVRAFDATGRLVWEKQFTAGANVLALENTRDWPSGIFSVQITDEQGNAHTVLKAVKMR